MNRPRRSRRPSCAPQGGPLSIETIEMEGPRDDEVWCVSRQAASATDISYVNEWYDASEGPLILGHEARVSSSGLARM
jgi:Zn-dependent alcohol dehydrogenase